MTFSELLSHLRNNNVRLWVEDGRLRYKGSEEVITSGLLDDLRKHKPEIISFLQQTESTSEAAPGAIHPVPRDNNQFPLSFAQEPLWFLDQLEPGNFSNHLATAVTLTGNLDRKALQKSIDEIIRRHEILRTNFSSTNGRPVQLIKSSLELIVSEIDVRKIPETARQAEIQRMATEEFQKPFDLAKDPLLRINLYQTEDDTHVLLLTMHHIISDGMSYVIYYRELSALYKAFSKREPSPLSELPVQYADYAHWEREWFTRERLEEQYAYWKKQLGGSLPVIELPADKPRPAVQTYNGSRQYLSMETDRYKALKVLSQQEGCSLFMTLIAALHTLLYHYTGQEDMITGSPIAKRNFYETENLIGLCLNMLVLRTNLEGNPTFRELLKQVKEVTLSAYSNQDVPFEKLVKELKIVRDLSRNALFQINLQLSQTEDLELPGLSVSTLNIDGGGAQFDLSVHLWEGPEGLNGFFEYNTDLFEAATIERMTGHFQNLIDAVIENPGQKISDVPLLTKEEKQQFIDWNNTRVDYPLEYCLHQLFEEQVKRSPDAVALIFEDSSLTYRELNNRANRLAYYLRTLGVGPDVLVGICADRSLEMVIGLYAILKAGGAYVPLDPNYPKDRLECMLEDSKVPIILVQKRLTGTIPHDNVQVLILDELLADINALNQPDDNLSCITKPEDMAYVIFTSGSTGRPKGVMNSHRGICNRLLWMQDEYNLTSEDVVLQKTPFSFDVSVWEFFWPLLTGARLVVARPEGHRDSAYLVKVIREQGVTTLHFVPSMLHYFVEDPGAGGCNSLKRVICSGEALPYELQERFFSKMNAELHNLYGPTEAAVDVTYWECQPGSDLKFVPIGSPVANTQMYILDEHMHPVPIGVSGELHIGGIQVAQGYVNRQDLTEEKFIPDPFSDEPGARLYKTGDLCRYMPDGNIEYLGRNDFQVKIRGLRIELGEIESVLGDEPKVKQCVVVAREEASGDKRLVAYLVPHNEAPSIDALREQLKQKLADYMIPSAFVILDELPLSPNGKIDRKALPEPDSARPDLDIDFVGPGTDNEKILSDIWAEVIGLKQVGIHDNFFALGGDSILSIQIIARANQAGLQLTPQQIFQYQTVAELATVAGTASTVNAEQGTVTGPVPLTPIQHWFFEQKLTDPHHWNMAVICEVLQPLEIPRFEKALQEVLVHHDALRLRFINSASGWQQENKAPDETIPFTTVDLTALPEEEQQTSMESHMAKLHAGLNLSEGPLLRVGHIKLGYGKPDRILIVIHHLAMDGVSWRILLEDLQLAYQQLSLGKAVQLPAKTTSFQHASQHMMEYARSDKLREEMDYWLGISYETVKPLHVDISDGINIESSVETVTVSLDEEETRSLLQEVPQAYNTQINDALLVALGLALSKWTGQHKVLINLEGHGREEVLDGVDLSRTVGWFTVIFPILLDLGDATQPGEALKSVKEQLRNIPNRGIGFGMLRYLSENQNNIAQLGALPRSDVMFNYLGQLDVVQRADATLKLLHESTGPIHSPRSERKHLLEINGYVAKGKLQLDWRYSSNIHRHDTIEHLARSFIEALQSLISHCRDEEAGGFTPSDFPDAQLDQEDLDDLISSLSDPEDI